MVDLHTHSTFSDGTFTPSEIVQKASELELKAVALTDHNTMEGISEFMSAGEKLGVNTIPGIEISATYANTEVHVLGLFVPIENIGNITAGLTKYRQMKEASMRKLVNRLHNRGYNIDWDTIKGDKPIGCTNRAHVAHALIDAGYAVSVDDAFNKYLGKEVGIYKESEKIKMVDAIKLLRQSGAVVSIAHPLSKELIHMINPLIKAAKGAGLDALETYHSSYANNGHSVVSGWAKRHKLFESGGSDFHGDIKPHVKLGVTRVGRGIPDDVYLNLHRIAENRQNSTNIN